MTRDRRGLRSGRARRRHAGGSTLLLAAVSTVAALIPAQVASRPTTTKRAPKTTPRTEPAATGWVTLDRHSEESSRAAFTACDTNGDDRLSLLEAIQALADLGDRTHLGPFRAIDGNADGYLGWPEFDRHFRRLVERGGTLRLRPARPFRVDSPPTMAAPAAPAELIRARLLATKLDTNHDGKVAIEEVSALGGGLTATWQARLRSLDADGSGSLSAAELVSLVRLLPGGGGAAAPPAGGKHTPLPGRYRAADRNGDGVLERRELENALLRMHPSLRRWTTQVLRDADRTGDGKLGPDELEGAQRDRR